MFPCLPLLCIVFLFLSAWFTTFKQTLTTNYLLNWVLWKGALKLIYKLSRLGQGGNSHREGFAGALQITRGSLARKVLHSGRGEGPALQLCVFHPRPSLTGGKKKKNPPDFFFSPVVNSPVKISIREVGSIHETPHTRLHLFSLIFPFKGLLCFVFTCLILSDCSKIKTACLLSKTSRLILNHI